VTQGVTKKHLLFYLDVSFMKKAEERIDRLERIARLLVRAGLRARRELRQQDDKITIMIDAQIKNEERFAKLAQAQTELAESQTNTDRRLDALIAILKEGRNGKSR
jgi:pyruvate-formate lyase